MDNKINNRLAFNIYVWTYFILTVFVIFYFIFFLTENITNQKISLHGSKNYILFVVLGVLAYLITNIIDSIIKPSYFEATINFTEINIYTFNPNKKNGFRFILMLFYRKYLIRHTIERNSYNSYRILIERFGFKKSLILQKTENGILYESSPINISFLGARSYTNLIISIDRLKEKFSLN